ncbi:hypothetical protein Igag_0777 [Ignisphaera aggregans DSM 17230]|uniref:Uncharacterized protein n=1 Tax=Ignisphaera aggregans (strain DSM 17230 / JCM 13409 / AQ1.S1) TaxID=583356 RepID=E0STC7_IGNAA|nr:hypothetical protein Igag_0777 [Ignisphaera aggregans DSM 17230]
MLGSVDHYRHDLLASSYNWVESEFSELLKRVRVWSICSDHDNPGLLIKMYNMLAENLNLCSWMMEGLESFVN